MIQSANKTVQRTGASRFAQSQIKRQRRLAPVADLSRSAAGDAGRFEQEVTELTERDSTLCFLG